MNTELLKTISKIEEENNTNFTDPFYMYSFVLDDMYNDYLANSRMCTQEGYYLEFLFHLEDASLSMEKTREIYLKRVSYYKKWRINGFKKSLYLVLSDEADDVADMLAECVIMLNEASDGVIEYSLFCHIEDTFKKVMSHVSRTSQSISVYHLENLW